MTTDFAWIDEYYNRLRGQAVAEWVAGDCYWRFVGRWYDLAR